MPGADQWRAVGHAEREHVARLQCHELGDVGQQLRHAAHALALPYWRRTWLIILPQALRVSVPPLVNTLIALLKDTSLVLIIGLFDLLSTVKISLTEPAWNGFGIEAYVFASLVYFVFCFSMSRYSRSFEHR